MRPTAAHTRRIEAAKAHGATYGTPWVSGGPFPGSATPTVALRAAGFGSTFLSAIPRAVLRAGMSFQDRRPSTIAP